MYFIKKRLIFGVFLQLQRPAQRRSDVGDFCAFLFAKDANITESVGAVGYILLLPRVWTSQRQMILIASQKPYCRPSQNLIAETGLNTLNQNLPKKLK